MVVEGEGWVGGPILKAKPVGAPDAAPLAGCLLKKISSRSGLLIVSLKADLPPLLLPLASSDRLSSLLELLELCLTTPRPAMLKSSYESLRRFLFPGDESTSGEFYSAPIASISLLLTAGLF